MSGTSQATPFVSAALALLRSRYPGYTPAQIVSAITSTGIPVSSWPPATQHPNSHVDAARRPQCQQPSARPVLLMCWAAARLLDSETLMGGAPPQLCEC